MKPKRIFLIRHGESEGNVNKEVYNTVPDWQISLTELGKQQAANAAEQFYREVGIEDVMIYASPWARARQTAAPFRIPEYQASPMVRYIEDPRLREQEWGNYQESELKKKIRVERKKYGSFFYRIPFGESGADVYDRVTTFFDTMYRDFKKPDFPQNVLIVSHGLTIKAFLMRWFHLSVEWFDKIDTPENCQLIEMELQANGKYVLKTELKEDEESF